jgi:hypothetical protein
MGLMGIHEFLPSNDLLTLAGQFVCNEQVITVEVCANVLFLIGGFNSEQLNRVSFKFQCNLRYLKIQLADTEMI